MAKVKVSDLSGVALDWAVAKCDGKIDLQDVIPIGNQLWGWEDGERIRFIPSTNWAQGGPIIEREKINLSQGGGVQAAAFLHVPERPIEWVYGPSPLIAAMRCYVVSKLGEEVDILEELLK